jgi:DNA-binding MarR family transcriptional regulator
VADDIEAEVRVFTALRRVVRTLRSSGGVATQRAGVTGAQLFVLQQLAATPEQSVSELMAATLTTQSSVSEVVDRLVARGLVSRRRASADARRVVLAATAKGVAAVRTAPASAPSVLVAGLQKMPRSRRRQLAALLEEWLCAAGIARAPATMFLEDELPGRVKRRNRTGGVPRAAR